MSNGKGSSRRPTSSRDALTCTEAGHVWLGGKCFRCGVVGGVLYQSGEWIRWPSPPPPPDGAPGIIADVDHTNGTITVSFDSTHEEPEP